MKKLKRKKMGRPPRSDIDRCQTAYWAQKVREMTGLTFAEIERTLDPDCAVLREDKGGYNQPQLWRKYGAGSVSPIGNGRSNKIKPTAVELIEQIAPDSKALYNSVLWSVLRMRKISVSVGKLYCEKIDVKVARILMTNSPLAHSSWTAVLKLDSEAMKALEYITHIDVMAIFLLHMKCAPWTSYRSIVEASLRWMKMMTECDPAFAVIEPKFTSVLKDYERWFRLQRVNLDLGVGRTSLPPKKSHLFFWPRP
ncbi:MAG: hypothetical protein Q7K57_15625 [Burkholderiaceae bacterium]|nr:hypothetical protein [Burkholderiaceae bacterium]